MDNNMNIEFVLRFDVRRIVRHWPRLDRGVPVEAPGLLDHYRHAVARFDDEVVGAALRWPGHEPLVY